eukprot:3185758-Rhodomonas_salina.1
MGARARVTGERLSTRQCPTLSSRVLGHCGVGLLGGLAVRGAWLSWGSGVLTLACLTQVRGPRATCWAAL